MATSIPFDRAAEFYDETRGFPPAEEAAIAALFMTEGLVRPQAKVLEVGVGTGRIALLFAPQVATAVGLDLARPMMQKLQAKQGHPTTPVQCIEGNALRLPFADSSFDAVVIIHVLHLIEPWRDVIAEIARILKTDGTFIVGGGNPSPLRQQIFEMMDWEHRTSRRIGADGRDAIRAYLHDDGWTLAAEAKHTYAVSQAPMYYVEQVRRRVWSHSWTLADEEIERRATELEAHIRNTFDDPAQPIPSEAEFELGFFKKPVIS